DCSRTILFSRDVSNPLHLRRLIVASSLTRHNLLVYLDDATSRLMALHFTQTGVMSSSGLAIL
ncbi:hypothetical protein, partial [Paraburkholderia youngii]